MDKFNIDFDELKPIFIDFAKKLKDKLESQDWFIQGEAYSHRDDLMDVSSKLKNKVSIRNMYVLTCISEEEIKNIDNDILINNIIKEFKIMEKD